MYLLIYIVGKTVWRITCWFKYLKFVLNSIWIPSRSHDIVGKSARHLFGFLSCYWEEEAYILINNYSAGIYLIKVNNRNTRIKCEICSRLTIKIPEWRPWRRSLLTLNIFTPCYSVSFVNFEHVNAAWVESYLGPTQASISPESSIKDVCKILNTSITYNV